MYSTYNKGKSVVAEGFITSKIYKHLTTVSKNIYFDVLNDIVDIYNNTHYKTIKMKPIDVKPDSDVESDVDSNEKDPKFRFSDHVIISKCKNIFAKEYAPNWPEEVFLIKKIKKTIPWTHLLVI